MKVLLSLFGFFQLGFFRDDWICGLVNLRQRNTRAQHTRTHILKEEKNHVKYHQILIVLICYCQFEPPIAT